MKKGCAMGNAKQLKPLESDFVITFGKHKGKTLDEIAADYPSYVVWLAEEGIMKIEREFLDACRMDVYDDDEGFLDD